MFTIREATIDDAESIALVLCLAWRWAYSSFLPAEFIEARSQLGPRTKRMRDFLAKPDLTLVAVDAGGNVIGFVNEFLPPYVEGFDAEIGGLYIAPDSARLGIGSALVKAMVDHFCSEGKKTMAIHTLADNPISCNFYEKIGGRRHANDTWNGYPSVWFAWDDLSIFG